MGNIDSRCRYDHGYICLQTAKPFYCPGEMITGNIYIRTSHPIEARYVELEVKGM
jgi:hypothetical protein